MKRASLGQALLAAALAVGPARDVRAQGATPTQPLSVTLEYDVPSACPDEREFKGIVSQRLARDPFAEGAPNRVLVLVSAADDRISGELVWRDNTGKSRGAQHFPSRSNHCAQIIQAMGFALAVQIQLLETEDSAAATTSNPEPSPPVPAPPKPTNAASQASSPSRATPIIVQRAQRPGKQPLLVVGGGGALALGMAAELVPAGRIFAGLRWPSAAVELALEASAPVTTRRADGAGFSQWYALASGAGCAVAEPLSACAVLRAGVVRVSGRDIDVPNSAGAALLQSGLRLALSQRLSQNIALSIRSEGLLNLTRWSATLDRFSVWTAPRLALDSGLDLMVLFR